MLTVTSQPFPVSSACRLLKVLREGLAPVKLIAAQRRGECRSRASAGGIPPTAEWSRVGVAQGSRHLQDRSGSIAAMCLLQEQALLAAGTSARAALTNVDVNGSAIVAAAPIHPVHSLIGLQQRGFRPCQASQICTSDIWSKAGPGVTQRGSGAFATAQDRACGTDRQGLATGRKGPCYAG